MTVDIANFIARNQPSFRRSEIDRGHYQNALMQNQVQRLPQQNRAQDLAIQGAEQNITDQQRETAQGLLANRFAAVAGSQNPRVAAQQFLSDPNFAAAGRIVGLPIDQFSVTEQDTDDAIRSSAQSWAQALGLSVSGGESFTLAPGHVRHDASGREIARNEATGGAGNFELVPGPNGSLLQINRGTGEVSQVLGREPQEPLETVLDPDTGKPVLRPRSESAGLTPYQKPTGGLSARDSTTARTKLNQIDVARQQLALVQQRFNAIKGSLSAGPAWSGQGLAPTEGGKQFDAAVDSMRNVLSAITRVPGIGSMSDFETRLAQAQFPTRTNHESVTQQQIDSIGSMLSMIEQGYSGLLSDSGAQMPSRETPDASAAPASGGVARIQTDADFDALPSGAQFVGPDGVLRQKP